MVNGSCLFFIFIFQLIVSENLKGRQAIFKILIGHCCSTVLQYRLNVFYISSNTIIISFPDNRSNLYILTQWQGTVMKACLYKNVNQLYHKDILEQSMTTHQHGKIGIDLVP